MKYILTEIEYNDLKSNRNKDHVKTEQLIFDLCRAVADHKPIIWGWGGDDPKPWGCMVTEYQEDGSEWFCDQCPVLNDCPFEVKKFSK